MSLLRYEKDSCSIPITGESDGLIKISPQGTFSVANDQVLLNDPDSTNGALNIGTHVQYTVVVKEQ